MLLPNNFVLYNITNVVISIIIILCYFLSSLYFIQFYLENIKKNEKRKNANYSIKKVKHATETVWYLFMGSIQSFAFASSTIFLLITHNGFVVDEKSNCENRFYY